ncbi:MAG: DNA-binding domain-containing protein [Pseudomonadota bacterium]
MPSTLAPPSAATCVPVEAPSAFVESQAAFARALLRAELPPPAGVRTAHGAGDAGRFAVYRNTVHVGLMRALAARFPVVERLVGPDFFAGMARAFVQDHKPRSPVIMEYGDAFPAFIAGFAPAGDLAYLPDVARLEAAWTRAYHAADAAPLALSDLAPLAREDALCAPLRLHPAASLLVSAHPVGTIWCAHQEGSGVAMDDAIAWRGESVLITRPALEVRVTLLPAHDHAFAQAVFAGAPLGAAGEVGLQAAPGFDFGNALVGLVALGALAAEQEEEILL